MRAIVLQLFLLTSLWYSPVFAHTLGVDKAELIEYSDASYHLVSQVPNNLAPLITTPDLPERCHFTSSPRGERGDYQVRFEFSCDSRLTANDKIILPWKREGVMLTVTWKGEEPVSKLTDRKGSIIRIDLHDYLGVSGSFFKAAQRYTSLGIEHILAGFDHLLFVLGLLLIVKGTWVLVQTITAFTVAHSITLGFATLGFVNVPSKPVEAAIALSIVFLAMEIIHGWQGRYGLVHHKPWIVAFGFGLLHGLGFAGALSGIGLPPREIPIALLFFNVGVEIGQLFFVMVMLSIKLSLDKSLANQPARGRVVPVYFMGTVACYWLIERAWEIIIP